MMKTTSPLCKKLRLVCCTIASATLLLCATASGGIFKRPHSSPPPTPVTDVSANISLTFNSWTLNRSSGALTGRVTLKNLGNAPLEGPFRFAITPTKKLRLTTVSGYFGKLTYLDVTSQVVPQLLRSGNRNGKLDKGESVTFTVSVFTAERVPIPSGHILSYLGVVEGLPTVTVAPDPAFTYAYNNVTPVKANFTRTGNVNATALTVYYTTGGTAVAGIDYVPGSGSVFFPIGAKTVSLSINPAAHPQTSTLIITTTPNANYLVGSPNQATLYLSYLPYYAK